MRHEPWQRAIDTKLETLKWHNADFGRRWTELFFTSVLEKARREDPESIDVVDIPSSTGILERLVRESLHRSDTIFVTEDMQHILMQAADDLPDDVVLHDHDLLTNIGYCQFAEPMYGQDVNDRMVSMSAISWILHPATDGNMYLNLFYFSDTDVNDDINPSLREMCRESGIVMAPMGLTHWFPLGMEESLPKDDVPGSKVVIGLLKMFIAIQLLAQQKIGETIIARPQRATRRRWELDENTYVSVITLRCKKAVLPPDHIPEKREYSHRFLVSSHWRKQWYPKTKTHGWKYIYEYIKGPEDKPLVIRQGRVFNFRR